MQFLATSALLALLPAFVAATSVPSYDGLSVVFKDDFWGEAGSSPDTSKWNIITGDLQINDEKETYADGNTNLQISGGGTVQIVPWKSSSATGGWTSGRIETIDTVTPAAGKVTRVEGSIRFGTNAASTKQGIWPAFWMLGDAMRHGTEWPTCGELDILEQKNGELTGYGTAHCDVSSGGVCNEPNGRGATVGIPADDDFHTWTIIWDRSSNNWATEQIQWLFDGNVYNTLTGAELADEAIWGTLAHSPFYIILNVAVGGAFPGDPNSATEDGYGAMMETAYVAVYTS